MKGAPNQDTHESAFGFVNDLTILLLALGGESIEVSEAKLE